MPIAPHLARQPVNGPPQNASFQDIFYLVGRLPSTLPPKPDYKIFPRRIKKLIRPAGEKIIPGARTGSGNEAKHRKSLPNGRQQGGAFGAAPRGRRFAPPPWGSCCLPFGKDFLCFGLISGAHPAAFPHFFLGDCPPFLVFPTHTLGNTRYPSMDPSGAPRKSPSGGGGGR